MHKQQPRALPAVLEDLPDRSLRDGPGGEALAKELAGLAPLQQLIGYTFDRPALLRTALTLGSWSNEHRRAGWPSNACLEFFGDAVLDLLAAGALWRRFPELSEGKLTRLRAAVVSEKALARVARTIELGDWLFLGKGDARRGVQEQDGTLADALEAVMGATFLDAQAAGHRPHACVEKVFLQLFGPQLVKLDPSHGLDAKSRLQQWAQANLRVTPIYEVVGDRPPPGAPHWRARVFVRRRKHRGDAGEIEILGEGEGRSLRLAERAAAEEALEQFVDGNLDQSNPKSEPVGEGS